MYVPTIEERLRDAIHGMTLLRLALNADAYKAGMDPIDVREAALPTAQEVSEHLYWIKVALADSELSRRAPTEDENPTEDETTGGAR